MVGGMVDRTGTTSQIILDRLLGAARASQGHF